MTQKEAINIAARQRFVNEREAKITEIIGENLRRMRMARSLSQGDVATILNVTFQQVQKYEKGVNRISSAKLFVLAEIFNVPHAEFFAGVTAADVKSLPPVRATNDSLRAQRLVADMPAAKQLEAVRILQAMTGGQAHAEA